MPRSARTECLESYGARSGPQRESHCLQPSARRRARARHTQVDAELAQATAQAVEWDRGALRRFMRSQCCVKNRAFLTARVEELANVPSLALLRFPNPKRESKGCAAPPRKPAKSLLRLHGEQQASRRSARASDRSAAKARSETSTICLETSMRARDDAECAAFDHESATVNSTR